MRFYSILETFGFKRKTSGKENGVKIRKIHGQKKQNNFLILNLIKLCQIFG